MRSIGSTTNDVFLKSRTPLSHFILLFFLFLIFVHPVFSQDSSLSPSVQEQTTLIHQPPRKIPYPIILIHGLGGSAEVFESDSNVANFLKDQADIGFGGVIEKENGLIVRSERIVDVNGNDFFAIEFTDPFGGISDLSSELGEYIAYVRQQTGAYKVILVGFSMGGVVARQYLVNNIEEHHVRKLVTIGSPHQGSAWALVYDINQWIKQNIDTIGFKTLDETFGRVEGLANEFFGGSFRLDKAALRDLRPPRNRTEANYEESLFPSATYLYHLNQQPHPTDLDYACIIGDIAVDDAVKELLDDIQSGGSSALKNGFYLVGNFLNNLINGVSDGTLNFSNGDGLVSIDSQNLQEVEFFKANGISERIDTVHVSVHHLKELWQHPQIIDALYQRPPILMHPEYTTRDSVFEVTGYIEDILLTTNKTTLRVGEQAMDIPLEPATGRFQLSLAIPKGETTITIHTENTFSESITLNDYDSILNVKISRKAPLGPPIFFLIMVALGGYGVYRYMNTRTKKEFTF